MSSLSRVIMFAANRDRDTLNIIIMSLNEYNYYDIIITKIST